MFEMHYYIDWGSLLFSWFSFAQYSADFRPFKMNDHDKKSLNKFKPTCEQI